MKKREKDRERWARKNINTEFILHFTLTRIHKKSSGKEKMKNENSSALKTHLPLALRLLRRQKSVFASWQTRVATWFIWPPLVFLSRVVRASFVLSVFFFLKKKTHKRSAGAKKVKKCWWLGKEGKLYRVSLDIDQLFQNRKKAKAGKASPCVRVPVCAYLAR